MKVYRLISLTVFLSVLFINSCKEPEPVASFSPSTFSARVDELITFTNTSENATTYNWSFGDGAISTDKDPSHAYASVGEYTVQLTASGYGGIHSVSSTIFVSAPQPVVEFTMDKTVAWTGEAIRFTNNSQHADSFVWSFGDGNSSTAENPVYSYSSAGTFIISLTATGDGGTASTTAVIQIEEALYNIIPGVRIGNFILGNNFEQHFGYIYEQTFGYFADTLEEGIYIHWIEFDTTGIGFVHVTDSLNLYYGDVPGGIYAFEPFVGNTEKEITFGSTLDAVEAAYGTPDEISESGSYSYLPSLGISFWSDTTMTYVSAIFIEEPTGEKKAGPGHNLRPKFRKGTSEHHVATWWK